MPKYQIAGIIVEMNPIFERTAKQAKPYLIETNGYSKGLDLALSFAKYLLCPNNYSNNKKEA